MVIDPNVLNQYFPQLEWRISDTDACATVASESRFFDPSITVLDHQDGTYLATLYMNDGLILSSWIEDESLAGVLASLQEQMTDMRKFLSSALPNREGGQP